MAMKIKEETVTPAIAEDWLTKNWRNRMLRPAHISRLARDMKAGRWVLNGEAIRFDTSGKLIDGQHRLLACMEAGAAFVSLVMYDCPPGVQGSLVGAVPRSFADELKMNGHAHTVLLSSSAKCCAVFDAFGHWEPQFTREITYFEQQDAFRKHEEKILSAAHYAVERYHRSPQRHDRIGVTQLSSMLVHFREHNREVADWFVDKAYSGAMIDEKEPIFLLRRVFAPRDPHRRLSHARRWAFTIRAFNWTLEGRKMSRLYWRAGGMTPEPFPRIGDVWDDPEEKDVEAPTSAKKTKRRKSSASGVK